MFGGIQGNLKINKNMLDKENKNNNVCGNEEHKYQNSKKYKSFQILCCSNFSFTKYCVDT